MYEGEVNVDQDDLQYFLAAAEELRIKGLSQVQRLCQFKWSLQGAINGYLLRWEGARYPKY